MAPTQNYTLSLHDALPISRVRRRGPVDRPAPRPPADEQPPPAGALRSGAWQRLVLESQTVPLGQSLFKVQPRSEEHTSELQSLRHLVCRLLLEKKKDRKTE